MTCEVAVMNKLGYALAADSAVTLGEGKKIYLNAEKLLELSSYPRVGAHDLRYGGSFGCALGDDRRELPATP